MFNWKKVKKDKQEVQETATETLAPQKGKPFYTNVTTKACNFCGKVFIPEHIAEKYCSEECKHEGRRIRQREYNRDYYAKTHPNSTTNLASRLDGDGLPKAHTCVQCGKVFYPKYGCQKTCSEECKKEFRLAYKREWNRKNLESKRNSARKWYHADKERKLAKKQNETNIVEEETMSPNNTKKKYTSEEYTRKIRNKTRYIIDTLRQLDKTGLDEEIVFEAINNINRMPLDNFDK